MEERVRQAECSVISLESGGPFARRLSGLVQPGAVRFRRSCAAAVCLSLLLLVPPLLVGCGLSGGSIPPGSIGGVPAGPSPFTATGRVQLASAPYTPEAGATVVMADAGGVIVAGPVRTGADGSFQFPQASGGQRTLEVFPADPTLQPVQISFYNQAGSPVQFVIATPPVSAVPPQSITLTADTLTPGISQSTQMQAVLSGGTPGIGPSWVALGSTGVLSAQGTVAQFTASAAGAAKVFAVAGSVFTNVSLQVPPAGGVVPPPPISPPPPPSLGPPISSPRAAVSRAGVTASG